MDETEKDQEKIAEEIIPEEEELAEENAAAKIKKLREELKECKKQKDEYLAGWQRAKADFINARNDEEKTRAEFKKFAASGILLEFLGLADSFEMAAKHGAGDGTEAIYAQFKEILKNYGLESIDALGKKFDPAYHEALENIATDDKEKEGVVLEEAQKGYLMRGEILRPAKVKVGYYRGLVNS